MNLKSKTINLRLIRPSDAEFVLSLRLDPKYNQYLSSVSNDIDAQRCWIEKYKFEEAAGTQYYFIIERSDGVQCGTIRVYDLREDSFCWGSWILNQDKTRFAAIESAFLIYDFGFNYLGFTKSHFDVMKGNDRVIAFHTKMGAKIINEDRYNYYFEIKREEVEVCKKNFMKRGLE